jgi:hypothetical protein
LQKGILMKKSGSSAWLFGLVALGLLLSVIPVIGVSGAEKDPDRITVAQLKEMLGRHDVTLVDVRDPISWDKSDSKIRGAVRENPEQLTAWANKYPKDKTLIFYCS